MALETHGHTYGPVVLESHAHAQFGDQYGDQYISVNHFHQQPHGKHALTTTRRRLAKCPIQPAAARPHLQPSIVLPFRRNRDFVLRDEFSILWNRRNEQGSCTAIVGLGGIGYGWNIMNLHISNTRQQIPPSHRICTSCLRRELEYLGVLGTRKQRSTF